VLLAGEHGAERSQAGVVGLRFGSVERGTRTSRGEPAMAGEASRRDLAALISTTEGAACAVHIWRCGDNGTGRHSIETCSPQGSTAGANGGTFLLLSNDAFVGAAQRGHEV
jgi:hypothetical protein